jgi:hypothetical protein
MEVLARSGFVVEGLGRTIDELIGVALAAPQDDIPPHVRTAHQGIPVTLYHRATAPTLEPNEADRRAFLRLFDATLARFRPDVFVTADEGTLTRELLAEAHRQGIATVVLMSELASRDPALFSDADAVVVPSAFAEAYYREALGLRCTILPPLIDLGRLRTEPNGPGRAT